MSPPWMPLYVGDYIADTAHLRLVEHGAYLLLIMHYWRNGGLPNDDGALSRIVRVSPREWQRIRPVIAELFDDGWKHKRIEFELTEAARISEAGRKGGIASGQARRVKANGRSTTVQRSSQRLGNDQPTNSEALHSQSQSLPEAKASGARKRATRLPAEWWPSLENINYAIGKGLSQQRISVEAEKFRNYWTAKSGASATKLDWDATWQNWILNSTERNGGPRNGGQQSLGDIARELADEVRERERSLGLG